MSKRELFDKVVEAYKSGDSVRFQSAALNWIASEENVPFEDVNARELFFYARRGLEAWRSQSINGRSGKKKMFKAVEDIVKLDLPNPYLKKTAEEEDADLDQPAEASTEEPAEEIKEEIKEEPAEKNAPEEIAEETEEESEEPTSNKHVNANNEYVFGVVDAKEKKGLFDKIWKK